SFGKLQADSLALIDQALDRVRNLSSDLHPTVLDDLGLAAALRWMLDRRAREAGFTTRCVARGMDERLPPEIESTAFRIAQEALTNVVRHANARNVRVELSRRKNVVKLLIVDDGIGFDPEAARAEALRGKSLGLVGMEERASLVNGRMVVRSAPGKGTELKLEIPLPVPELHPSTRERSRSS
ncbi:MAG TPA: sensor histidine kinase, partial [Nitrospiria bacterium]|nr:sensor histidine kinase [Nitrospiria bacterium]